MGRPKALVRGSDGEPWVVRGAGVLRDAGCDPVLVVLGADADLARELVPAGAEVVVAEDWDDGMSASLRAGLVAAEATRADAVVVLLVDLVDVGWSVVARLVERAGAEPELTRVLVRAAYRGSPGHPVVIGREHWKPLRDSAIGDRGARDYLAANPHLAVECGDLASGADADTPDQVT